MRWPRSPRPRNSEERAARDRERMVSDQLVGRGITDPEVLAAFGRVERHRFVDDGDPYGDHALPLGSGQTISQPYVVALMTAAARPATGWADAPVLEIGTGSGYQAAILAELGATVVSIERHADLADSARRHLAETGHGERVAVMVGDGSQGWVTGAPYRAILVTAGGPAVPTPLLEQLDRDGRPPRHARRRPRAPGADPGQAERRGIHDRRSWARSCSCRSSASMVTRRDSGRVVTGTRRASVGVNAQLPSRRT